GHALGDRLGLREGAGVESLPAAEPLPALGQTVLGLLPSPDESVGVGGGGDETAVSLRAGLSAPKGGGLGPDPLQVGQQAGVAALGPSVLGFAEMLVE